MQSAQRSLSPHEGVAAAIASECDRLEVAVDPDVQAQIATFFSELARWSQRIRLTGNRNAETLVREHFADALIAATQLPLMQLPTGGARCLDVGAGGGLPGMVIALLDRSIDLTLVEANGKKCAFLRHIAHRLRRRVKVVEARIEAYASGATDDAFVPYDIAWSRAAFAPDDWIAMGSDLIAPSGILFVFATDRALITNPDRTMTGHTYTSGRDAPRQLIVVGDRPSNEENG